jgi:hypothetical protein
VRTVAKLLGIALALSAGAARGQTITERLPGARGSGTKETIDRELAMSRFHLGPIFASPEFTFGGIGYTNTGSGSEEHPRSDFTSDSQAGVRVIVPAGPRIFFRGLVGASYIWFAHAVERRHVGLLADFGALATVGRFTIDAAADYREALTNIAELDRPLTARTLSVHALATLEVYGPVSIYGDGRLQMPRYSSDGLPSNDPASSRNLERTDTLYGGGLAYKFSSFAILYVGIDKVQLRFKTQADRDANSTGYVGHLVIHRGHLMFDIGGGWREYEPVSGAGGAKTNGFFGSGRADYGLRKNFEWTLYGYRRRNESIYNGATFFVETLGGTGPRLRFGRHTFIQFHPYVNIGTNQYNSYQIGTASFDRQDKILRYGAEIGFPVTRRFHLEASVARSRYTSNLETFSRTLYHVSTHLTYVPRGREGSR